VQIHKRMTDEQHVAAKPYIDLKTKIYSIALPTVFIRDGKIVGFENNFTEEQKELLQLADEMIEIAMREIHVN